VWIQDISGMDNQAMGITHLLLLLLLRTFELTEMLQQGLKQCLLRYQEHVLAVWLRMLELLLLLLVVEQVGQQVRTPQPSAAPWKAAGQSLGLGSANHMSRDCKQRRRGAVVEVLRCMRFLPVLANMHKGTS
jgi:hypothetical protein